MSAELRCIGCEKTPNEIKAYAPFAEMNGYETNADFVWNEEGTLNSKTGRFACDACYAELGMPVGPNGSRWRAGDPITLRSGPR